MVRIVTEIFMAMTTATAAVAIVVVVVFITIAGRAAIAVAAALTIAEHSGTILAMLGFQFLACSVCLELICALANLKVIRLELDFQQLY